MQFLCASYLDKSTFSILGWTTLLLSPSYYIVLSHNIDSIRLLKIEMRNRIDYRASYKPASYRGAWEDKTTSAVLITFYSISHVSARAVSNRCMGCMCSALWLHLVTLLPPVNCHSCV